MSSARLIVGMSRLDFTVEPTMPDENEHGKDMVSITIDNTVYQIHRGKQNVSDLKKVANIALAYQLDQDVNGVLTPLDQNGHVTIKGGEIFVSFPATGSSS